MEEEKGEVKEEERKLNTQLHPSITTSTAMIVYPTSTCLPASLERRLQVDMFCYFFRVAKCRKDI